MRVESEKLMQKSIENEKSSSAGLARHMPVSADVTSGPEGALIPDDGSLEDKIAVVYNLGDTPPEITITETAGSIQTVCANGVAVAIIARAEGPRLTVDDVLLVERYVNA